ncbi:UDP-N-acetylenolpyruvoylglucosamine reductase [Cellulophaga algicola DSM 14237]|uniref:UDP-N-acetylenolpyruvoylglucosamine reductase n=1 Tax=Cellulophaga algicola (strain DSM 14237 / IC166 / ACAM 630) TaxID=688270 RepID=E6X6R4_CELAD|nr:UDP-N-acetylmuramate dehydrogenase [Cellulophaga algicola]ADV49602.1 UDP-N-acetylenolpyruvoylglucosamine reductase [Cellulophaga algicola DSM 14237]
MKINNNVSLLTYNTFGINAKARFFCEITTIEELELVLKLEEYPNKFVISGGSNMLLTKDIDALVLYLNLKGITMVSESDTEVVINVMAGENWHQLVLWTLEQDYGGLENMSLIPGNTGTSPIQNIGAYGVELKDTFESCEAMEIATQEIKSFSKEDCCFGYRESFFKNEGKGKYIITSVNLKLSKKDHVLNTSYGAIDQELQHMGITAPTIKDVSNAVIAIRKSKLPDPAELGNSGSFFKNPIIHKIDFLRFSEKHPEAPFYKLSEENYKIPAGWLIEQSGFKGKRYGDAGVHKNQALVLVNYGTATGKEIVDLAHKIIDTVYAKFNIRILPEVNVI